MIIDRSKRKILLKDSKRLNIRIEKMAESEGRNMARRILELWFEKDKQT